MKYRYANRTEVNAEARKREALEADIRAFATWIEAQVNGVDNPDNAVKKERSYADKRLVEEECSQADVRASRQDYLESWIRRIENEHAEMEAKAEVRVENGEDPGIFRRNADRLERYHDMATAELDKLLNETPREERRRRARVTKKAAASKAAPVKKTGGRATPAKKRVSSS